MAPLPVRVIAWFYYAASAAGTIGGVVKMVEDVRAGHFNFAFDLGIGMSSGAIARGLQIGDVRAWRWARRLAAAAAVLMLVVSVLLSRFPLKTTLGLPWGAQPMSAGDPRVIYFTLAVAAIGAAQWAVLSTRESRRYFIREAPRPQITG